MWLAKLISSFLGIGYIVPKGAGTITAAIGCMIWYLVPTQAIDTWVLFFFIVSLFLIGVWSSSMVEKHWGKDNNKVVVDELLGICVSLFLLPVTWKYILASFLFFRFFDIIKPLYIRKAEQLPSGWGVMTDDLLAGIFTNLLLQLVATLNLF